MKRLGILGIAFAFVESRKFATILALIVVLLVQGQILFGSYFFAPTLVDLHMAPEQEKAKTQARVEPDKIIAGPKNIKEKTAVYFFLGWMWVAIGVLIYILRLKIKEVDRLHALEFFTPHKK